MHGAVIQVGARSVRDNFARCPGVTVLLGAAGFFSGGTGCRRA